MSRPRIAVTLLVSLLLSLAGVGAVVLARRDFDALAAVTRIPAPALIAAVALLVVSHLAGAARLFVLARVAGERIAPASAARAYLLGLFSAAVTPSGGGHVFAIGFALRRDGLPGGSAWSVAAYPTVVDLLFYAWSIPIALAVVASTLSPDARWIVVLAAPLALLLLAGWYLLAFQLTWLERLLAWSFSVRWLRRWRRRAIRGGRTFVRRMASLSAMPPATVLLLQFLTIVLHLANYLILYTIAAALGAAIEPPLVVAVTLLASASSYAVPTPGGSGYLELALSIVLTRQAEVAQVAPAVLTWRGLCHYTSLAFGPIVAGSLWMNAARTEDAQPP